MAFALVQAVTQITGTAQNPILTITSTGAGNVVIVHIAFANGIATVSSVTDNASNTYATGSVFRSGVNSAYQAYGVQVSGGNTQVTINFSTSVSYVIYAEEYSGGASTNAAINDNSTTGTGSSTSLAVSTLTTAATGELIVSTGGVASNRTWTQGSGFTLNGSGARTSSSQYKLSGAASETAPMTISGSNTTWIEIARAYKPFVATSIPNKSYIVRQATNRASTF